MIMKHLILFKDILNFESVKERLLKNIYSVLSWKIIVNGRLVHNVQTRD